MLAYLLSNWRTNTYIIGVSRWLDYLINIKPLTTRRFFQESSKLCQILNKRWQNGQSFFKIMPKCEISPNLVPLITSLVLLPQILAVGVDLQSRYQMKKRLQNQIGVSVTTWLTQIFRSAMEPFSRRRWTAIPAQWVSNSVHEVFFASAVSASVLNLIYHGAGTVVHLLLLKGSLAQP